MEIVSSTTKDELEGGGRAESSFMSYVYISKGILNLVEKLGKSTASWSTTSGAYTPLGLD